MINPKERKIDVGVIEKIMREKILIKSTEWYSFIDETIKEASIAIRTELEKMGGLKDEG